VFLFGRVADGKMTYPARSPTLSRQGVRMRNLSLLLLLMIAATACTKRDVCPDGAEPRTYDYLLCDEVTRTCETRTETTCPCRGDACVFAPTCRGITGVAEWLDQTPSAVTHVVDGAFTGEEWTGATKLQGMFTDVYMDYREGRLYFLNDWRANSEGARPTCFNYFQIRVGTDYLDLRVFGDGHVEVTRNRVPVEIANEGAYGFGPSATWSVPHTIFEFSLALEASQIDVCCFDPVTESQCEQLTHEPVVMSVRASASGVQVAREVPADTPRRAVGGSCNAGEGVCVDGARCEPSAAGPTCVEVVVPDGGVSPDAGVADSGPVDAAPPF